MSDFFKEQSFTSLFYIFVRGVRLAVNPLFRQLGLLRVSERASVLQGVNYRRCQDIPVARDKDEARLAADWLTGA